MLKCENNLVLVCCITNIKINISFKNIWIATQAWIDLTTLAKHTSMDNSYNKEIYISFKNICIATQAWTDLTTQAWTKRQQCNILLPVNYLKYTHNSSSI